MESAKQNKLLTEVGKGTPMGNLMRRYWQPIGALVDLDNKWTRRIRLLGEDLVLFKDRQGRLGLIAEQCPHRRASFAHGIPTQDGIRCPYHAGSTTRKANASTSPTSKTNVHSETKSAPTPTQLKKWAACFGPTWVPSHNLCCPAGMALWQKAPFASWVAPSCRSIGCKSWKTHWTPFIPSGCMVITMSS